MTVEFGGARAFKGRSWIPDWLFEFTQSTLPGWMGMCWHRLTTRILYKEIPIEGEMKNVVMKLRMDLRKKLEGEQNG